jgi:hypothetical protein
MLSEGQAREIVEASINKTAGPSGELTGSLLDAGITQDKLNTLVITLVADPHNGVPRFQHYLDANFVAELTPMTSVDELTCKVLRLSAGKMCSNPATPHMQECCPYPTVCPECGYPVP